MPRLRPLLAGSALVLLACLGTGAAAAAKPPAAVPALEKQPAMAAGAFLDSVGVNLAPGDDAPAAPVPRHASNTSAMPANRGRNRGIYPPEQGGGIRQIGAACTSIVSTTDRVKQARQPGHHGALVPAAP